MKPWEVSDETFATTSNGIVTAVDGSIGIAPRPISTPNVNSVDVRARARIGARFPDKT
ncbi:hypothetical protein AB0M44_25565 [Streptosporangium subroseum]|uniref:hypothetical protein n=1 Tax=Streptosporangium subroseum TaxID=106412 RepID=UPI00341D816C